MHFSCPQSVYTVSHCSLQTVQGQLIMHHRQLRIQSFWQRDTLPVKSCFGNIFLLFFLLFLSGTTVVLKERSCSGCKSFPLIVACRWKRILFISCSVKYYWFVCCQTKTLISMCNKKAFIDPSCQVLSLQEWSFLTSTLNILICTFIGKRLILFLKWLQK